MNDYEAKIEAKRERYAARAAKARAESSSAHKASRQIANLIPMGQPILVGHHSERRHRRDLDRIDRGMRKAIEADEKAAHYERKAESYGTHGVSSDDPEAVVKLRAKLAKLEEQREAYKAHNKAARKAGTEQLPKYVLSNLGANIRRYKKRIEVLEAAADRPEAEAVAGDGFRIEECKDANRIRFYFDERPDRDTCRKMKRSGFRWAPSVGAWQRQLSSGAAYAAKHLAKELFGWSG